MVIPRSRTTEAVDKVASFVTETVWPVLKGFGVFLWDVAGAEVIMPLTRPHRMRALAAEMPSQHRYALADAIAAVDNRRPGPGRGVVDQSTTVNNGGSTYQFNGVDLNVALEQAERRERRRMALAV